MSTFRLEAVREFLANQADELEVEGINSTDYWLARASLDETEFMDFAMKRVKAVWAQDQNDIAVTSMALWLDAFFIGYVAGRRAKDWLST